jgi:hypothetical protein
MDRAMHVPVQPTGHEVYLDEALIDAIWRKLDRQVTRDEVRRVAHQVAARYHNARITQYVPVFILRRTCEILQASALPEHG